MDASSIHDPGDRAGRPRVASIAVNTVPHLCPFKHAAQAAPISDLWMPDNLVQVPTVAAAGGGAASASVGFDDHKPRTPPPDLPSLLLDSRITYLGMPVGVLCTRSPHFASLATHLVLHAGGCGALQEA